MRVLLIYPPISKEERYSSAIGSAGGRQMPLGVFYLASCLRQRGHEVAVIDGEAENLTAADILRAPNGFSPAWWALARRPWRFIGPCRLHAS